MRMDRRNMKELSRMGKKMDCLLDGMTMDRRCKILSRMGI
jgi:hypothetical protein